MPAGVSSARRSRAPPESSSVGWRDMTVVNLETGQPTLELSGGALNRLAELTPAGMTARLHLTLSDEEPYAQAIVLIEAAP